MDRVLIERPFYSRLTCIDIWTNIIFSLSLQVSSGANPIRHLVDVEYDRAINVDVSIFWITFKPIHIC